MIATTLLNVTHIALLVTRLFDLDHNSLGHILILLASAVCFFIHSMCNSSMYRIIFQFVQLAILVATLIRWNNLYEGTADLAKSPILVGLGMSTVPSYQSISGPENKITTPILATLLALSPQSTNAEPLTEPLSGVIQPSNYTWLLYVGITIFLVAKVQDLFQGEFSKFAIVRSLVGFIQTVVYVGFVKRDPDYILFVDAPVFYWMIAVVELACFVRFVSTRKVTNDISEFGFVE